MGIVKIQRPKPDYAATYRLDISSSRHKYQFVSVKYQDDADAIDLLLENDMERQARILMETDQNHLTQFN